MAGEAFKQLILFHDGGSLILRAPQPLAAQVQSTAVMGDVSALRPGDIVFVVHRQANGSNQVVLLAAQVLAIESRNNMPLLSLLSLNGQTIKPGDSGGGVWVNGRYIGNLRMTVREVRREWWRFNRPVETYTAHSYAAGLTADLTELVSVVLEPQKAPTVQSDRPS